MDVLVSVWSWIADYALVAIGVVVVLVAVVAVGLALRARQSMPAPVARKKAGLGERLEEVQQEAVAAGASQPAAPPASAERARRPAPAAPGPAGSVTRQDDRQILGSLAEKRSDPSTPAGALAIESGRLAYQIPRRMWLGVLETVEVRLGRLDAQGLTQGFGGGGEVRTENTPIVETMSVSLVCEPGAFEIEARSERDQLVKPDLVKGTPFHKDDFGRWVWLVTPLQRGEQTLLVKVSAAIRDSRGLPTTSSLPDKVIAVTVRVHLARATMGAIARAAPGLAWAVATTLVGIFTKDYWWPAVRNWIGWG